MREKYNLTKWTTLDFRNTLYSFSMVDIQFLKDVLIQFEKPLYS